ncbi:hypothetical protein Agub_g11729 [Astrephomene gubernaculifera]|uniref:Uncharacterized protein n=1 Tax=Astrephomene gubernaculifera TaxID=47775 RepID=A0AAD3HR20_9CHLO|nr:hypothetical protein Agub_g11729 [Astrephomene gubernaculifera]
MSGSLSIATATWLLRADTGSSAASSEGTAAAGVAPGSVLAGRSPASPPAAAAASPAAASPPSLAASPPAASSPLAGSSASPSSVGLVQMGCLREGHWMTPLRMGQGDLPGYWTQTRDA